MSWIPGHLLLLLLLLLVLDSRTLVLVLVLVVVVLVLVFVVGVVVVVVVVVVGPGFQESSCRDQNPQHLTLLTSKCASPHKGMHFLNISPSQSALRQLCFNTF